MINYKSLLFIASSTYAGAHRVGVFGGYGAKHLEQRRHLLRVHLLGPRGHGYDARLRLRVLQPLFRHAATRRRNGVPLYLRSRAYILVVHTSAGTVQLVQHS